MSEKPRRFKGAGMDSDLHGNRFTPKEFSLLFSTPLFVTIKPATRGCLGSLYDGNQLTVGLTGLVCEVNGATMPSAAETSR
jgi:hypothetical protein